jgi:hypothetical protein
VQWVAIGLLARLLASEIVVRLSADVCNGSAVSATRWLTWTAYVGIYSCVVRLPRLQRWPRCCFEAAIMQLVVCGVQVMQRLYLAAFVTLPVVVTLGAGLRVGAAVLVCMAAWLFRDMVRMLGVRMCCRR